jgi:hypothetical protein
MAVIPFSITDVDGDMLSIYTVSTDDGLIPDEILPLLAMDMKNL